MICIIKKGHSASVNFALDVLVCDLSSCKDLAHFFSLSILQFCGKPTFRTGRFDLQNILPPKKGHQPKHVLLKYIAHKKSTLTKICFVEIYCRQEH